MEMRWRHPLVICVVVSCSGSRRNLETQLTNIKLHLSAFILSVRSDGAFRCSLLKIEAAYIYLINMFFSLLIDVSWCWLRSRFLAESRFWSAASVLLPDRFPSSDCFSLMRRDRSGMIRNTDHEFRCHSNLDWASAAPPAVLQSDGAPLWPERGGAGGDSLSDLHRTPELT